LEPTKHFGKGYGWGRWVSICRTSLDRANHDIQVGKLVQETT